MLKEELISLVLMSILLIMKSEDPTEYKTLKKKNFIQIVPAFFLTLGLLSLQNQLCRQHEIEWFEDENSFFQFVFYIYLESLNLIIFESWR